MKNIFSIIKKLFIISLVIVFSQTRACALDEKYDWASGYKFTSQETMDDKTYFKNQLITGGAFQTAVPLMSTWTVTQGNWNDTYGLENNCRALINSRPPCTAAGTFTYPAIYRYTCSGDVSYNLNTNISARNLVGGDTMYGAWSMLFSYFPPVYDTKSCSQFGRCFVGNAFIMDTKAQKEDTTGRLWGLGVKELVEGPGDVFYFDQVRAMTQPPKDTGAKYNNPYLVGNMVPGRGVSVGSCDIEGLLDAFGTGDPACGLCNSDSIGSLATRILEAAGAAFNVPAANIWAAMLHEGATWSQYWGNGNMPSDDDILSWSLTEECGGEPMPACDNDNPLTQPPFGHLAYWFYLGDGNNALWRAVQVIDPSRDTKDRVSRCNFLDAAFASAKLLRQGSTNHAGITCNGIGPFTNVAPIGCNWSDFKIAQSHYGYQGMCHPDGGATSLPYIVSTFHDHACY